MTTTLKTLTLEELIALAQQYQVPRFEEVMGDMLVLVSELGEGVAKALSLEAGTPFLRNSDVLTPLLEKMQIPSNFLLPQNLHKTVIICDDDPLQRMLATAALEGRGLHVLEAESAEHCLDIIDSGATIDLLILDIMLPGMSGIDLLKLLQGRNTFFPSITISGVCPRDATEQASTGSGSMMHLSKPVNWASFGQLAKELVSVSASLS